MIAGVLVYLFIRFLHFSNMPNVKKLQKNFAGSTILPKLSPQKSIRVYIPALRKLNCLLIIEQKVVA